MISCPNSTMLLSELLQQVASSSLQPRKAVKKTVSLLKNKSNHEELLTLLLPVLEAKKDTSNLAVIFKFLGLLFESLNLGRKYYSNCPK